jgi:hypothetical protein
MNEHSQFSEGNQNFIKAIIIFIISWHHLQRNDRTLISFPRNHDSEIPPVQRIVSSQASIETVYRDEERLGFFKPYIL